jgi:hypothetical protein
MSRWGVRSWCHHRGCRAAPRLALAEDGVIGLLEGLHQHGLDQLLVQAPEEWEQVRL